MHEGAGTRGTLLASDWGSGSSASICHRGPLATSQSSRAAGASMPLPGLFIPSQHWLGTGTLLLMGRRSGSSRLTVAATVMFDELWSAELWPPGAHIIIPGPERVPLDGRAGGVPAVASVFLAQTLRPALVGMLSQSLGNALWQDHLMSRWPQQGSSWLPVTPSLGMQGTGLGWEEAGLCVSPILPRPSLWVPGRVSSSCTWKRLQGLGLCEARLLEGPSAPGPAGRGLLCRRADTQRPLRAGCE